MLGIRDIEHGVGRPHPIESVIVRGPLERPRLQSGTRLVRALGARRRSGLCLIRALPGLLLDSRSVTVGFGATIAIGAHIARVRRALGSGVGQRLLIRRLHALESLGVILRMMRSHLLGVCALDRARVGCRSDTQDRPRVHCAYPS